MTEQSPREALIELKLREVRQLFHHLDPAPFAEKDLDPAAESWIEDSVRELGPGTAVRLRIWLPPEQAASEDARTLPPAIQNYFAARRRQLGLELNRQLRRATTNLLIGLAFLSVCLTLRQSLLTNERFELLSEGLLIIGWVALWRPVENFLYDWWPAARRIRRLARIARTPVEVRSTEDTAPGRPAQQIPD
jgi:hypothetical protein